MKALYSVFLFSLAFWSPISASNVDADDIDALITKIQSGEVTEEDIENPKLRRLGWLDKKDFGQRCTGSSFFRWNRCSEGLDCTTTMAGRACLPTECVQNAVAENEQEMPYFDMILDKAGLKGQEDILINRTTIESRRYAMSNDGFKYILNGDAQAKIVQAMKDNPFDFDSFKNRIDGCAGVAREASVNGTSYFAGGQIELAAGVNVHNSYYWFRDTNTTNDAIMTDICVGVGTAAGASVGGMGGVAFTGTQDDVLDWSIMIEVDAAAVVGIGGAVKVNVPNNVIRIHGSLTVGAKVGRENNSFFKLVY